MTDAEPKGQPVPAWSLILACVGVALMPMQVSFPGPVPLTLADVAMGLAFAGLLFVAWRQGRGVAFAWPVAAFLVVYALANVLAGSGLKGAIESAQKTEQLLCGVLVVSLLLSQRSRWVVWLVAAGLAVNVLAALNQSGQGFGPGVTGLFRSRMALSLYLTVALAWSLPFWLQWARSLPRAVVVVLAMTLVLAFVAHGQMLVAAVVVLGVVSMLHSRRGLTLTLCSVVLLLLSLWIGPGGAGRTQALSASLSPFREGRVRQAHTELVAAVRAANEHKLVGHGAGNYQGRIGTYYRELPNPSFNDIETDTQSGLGILLATAGYPATALLVFLLLAGLVHGVERYHGSGGESVVHLAGAAGLLAVLPGLLLSDPFVRGLAWYVAVALAAVCQPVGEPRRASVCWTCELGWREILGCCVALGVLTGLVAVRGRGGAAPAPRPSPRPVDDTVTQVSQSAAAGVAAGTATASVAAAPVATGTFEADVDFFRVIDASDAKEIGPPMISAKDPRAGKGTILRIPDKAGVPPEDGEPGMKHGGASFEIEAPKDIRCNVWLRVWWEGSCGNSIFYQLVGKQPMVVGNDGTYDAWHWLPAPGTHNLVKGTNRFLVLNREDGVRFDQVLITGDLEYVPQGIEEE